MTDYGIFRKVLSPNGLSEKEEQMKQIKKRLGILFLVCVLAGCFGGKGILSRGAEAADGYTTDENGLMEWKNAEYGINVRGYVGEKWTKVTFSDRGFAAKIFNGNSSLSVTPKITFLADGKAIMITYVVTNNGEQIASDFRFWLGADTMVAENDASKNSVDADNVVTMTNETENVSFFAFSTTIGGTAVPTEWKARADFPLQTLLNNASIDPAQVSYTASAGDSAFVMYFPKESLLPGESTEFTAVVGMGDSTTISSIIESVKAALAINPDISYPKDAITSLTPAYKYAVVAEDNKYTMLADEQGNIPLMGTDIYGKEYDLSGKRIYIYQKGDGESVPSSVASVMDLADRFQTPDALDELTNTIADMGKESIVTTTDSITVKANSGQEYSIDGTSWVQADESGQVVFSGLANDTEYTLTTRRFATDTSPASLPTEGVSITTKMMFTDVQVAGFTGAYDRQTHMPLVKTNVQDARIAYTENPDADFSEECPGFKNSGEHIVYYKVSRDGYYNKFGSVLIKIDANDLEQDDLAAQAARDAISDIYPIEATDECGEKIQSAREIYESLTPSQQKLVDNYDELTWAEEEYPEVKAGIEHVHTYSQEWEKDENYHWKKAVCRHKDVTSAKERHDFKLVSEKKATTTSTGEKIYSCNSCGATSREIIAQLPIPEEKEQVDDKQPPKEEPVDDKQSLKSKNIIKDKAGNQYKVTSQKKKEVSFKAPVNKKMKKIVVPRTVKEDGVTYKVTGIEKNALKGCGQLKDVQLPDTCVKIGATAFTSCKKLQNIVIKSKKIKSSTVAAKAFKGVPKSAVIKVPKKQRSSYTKLFAKKGFKGKVK